MIKPILVINETYECFELLGEGGMGEVYRAFDRDLEREVAVKVIHGHNVEVQYFRDQFEREAKIAAGIHHPNNITIHAYGIGEDMIPFLVMEYINGPNLASYLKNNGPLSTKKTVEYGLTLAHVLALIHKAECVHRDVKSNNILLDNERVVLSDYGLVFDENATRPAYPSPHMHTPEYASPEQKNREQLDGRSDLYSLGVVLFECLTGRLPLHDKSISTQLIHARKDISQSLADIIQKCLAEKREDRYESANELSQALEREQMLIRYPAPPLYPTQTLDIDFIWIPPGIFQMGSPKSEDHRKTYEYRHEVEITQGFWLGKYPVTQHQWAAIMGENPSRFKDPEKPVESVSWNDVQAFIDTLNTQEKTKAYRLPTEAEWEYACRAGSPHAYYFGNQKNVLKKYAWYTQNARSPRPVGIRPENKWGLHDMHGNVMEWVQDKYDADYFRDSPRTDPPGPTHGLCHVLRGGAWNSPPEDLRSASRSFREPDFKGDFIGFRLVKMAT